VQLFDYMKAHKIGLVAVAYDEHHRDSQGEATWGGIVSNFDGATTKLTGGCGADGWGQGNTVKWWYNHDEVPGSPL
jgi:hypothetical protein